MSRSRVSRPVVTVMSRSVGPGCMVSAARVHHAGCTSAARHMDLAVLRVAAGNVDLSMSRGVVGRGVVDRPVVMRSPSRVRLVTAVNRSTVGRTVKELMNRSRRLGRRTSVVGRRGSIVGRRSSMVSAARVVNTCGSSATRHVHLAVLRVPARHVHALLQGGCRQRQQHQ